MATVRPGPAVAPPVTSFDGSYRTTIRVIGSFGSGKDIYGWCSSPGQPVITVTNGQFTYAVPHPNVPGEASPEFPATIKADGTFYGAITVGTISGSITGGRIEGTIDGSACVYAFTGNRA
jgi:hypothetical protein